MSNGGKNFNPMHTAHRYRAIACGTCGAEFMAYGQRKLCDNCKAEQKNTPEAKQKEFAQRAVVRAVSQGKLIRRPCVLCEIKRHIDPKSHGHHEDYARPLEVIWLCSFHHISRHSQINSLRASELPCPPLTTDELIAQEIRDHNKVRADHPTWKISPAPWDADYGPSADYYALRKHATA